MHSHDAIPLDITDRQKIRFIFDELTMRWIGRDGSGLVRIISPINFVMVVFTPAVIIQTSVLLNHFEGFLRRILLPVVFAALRIP